MSLQLAAQHLASKGRGNDSRLIHISPNELKGLQAIARAKGGSLTINPETGLPEAGFLEDILPVAATAATMAFFPAAAPALGGMFGASGALATGLGAGLMAGGFNLLGQAIGGQGINLGKALTSGAITGATAGALQGLGAYTPTADVATKTAATSTTPLTAAQAIDATPAFAYTPSGEMVSSAYPASVTGAVNTAGVVPPPPAGIGPAASTALTGGQKLALGLGGVGALSLLGSSGKKLQPFQPGSAGQIRPYEFTATPTMASPYPSPYTYDAAGLPVTNTAERKYFDMGYTALPPYNAAAGGIMQSYQAGGPVERMSQMNTAMNPQGGLYPQGMIDKTQYATPIQRPVSSELVMETPAYEKSNPMLMAEGGISTLGDYSDGGRLLKGPGDGVSDDIPAMIGKKQPARLADGEFVIPARIVSEIGNGSTDAGARRLYDMMDRVQSKRQKSAKKGKFAMNTKAEKDLPA